MLKKYGFGEIVLDGVSYKINPTLGNIEKLDDPIKTIEQLATCLNVNYRLLAAVEILNACVDPNLPEEFTGEFKLTDSGLKYTPPENQNIPHDLIVLAEHCVRHGIVGDAETESSSKESSSEFDVYEYIEIATNHLGMSTDDALKLTMTQLIRLLINKGLIKKGKPQAEIDELKAMVEWQKQQDLASRKK